MITAIVRVPLSPGLRLIKAHRIRIGWASCKIKEIETSSQRCARCKGDGHFAKECTGTETRSCHRCKTVGRLRSECTVKMDDEGAQSSVNQGQRWHRMSP